MLLLRCRVSLRAECLVAKGCEGDESQTVLSDGLLAGGLNADLEEGCNKPQGSGSGQQKLRHWVE